MRRLEIPAPDLADEVVVASVLELQFKVGFGFVEGGDDVVEVRELVAPFGEDDRLAGAGDSVGEWVDVFGAGANSGAGDRDIVSRGVDLGLESMCFTLDPAERLRAPDQSYHRLCYRENRHCSLHCRD